MVAVELQFTGAITGQGPRQMIRKGVKMLRLYDGKGKSDDGGVSLEGGERPIHRRR